MKTQQLTIERASAMPAPTWHFLRMNDTQLDIPEGLELTPDVRLGGKAVSMPQDEAVQFDEAMARAQVAWEQAHPAPTAEELAEREAFLAAEADATYGGTARSAYQIGADALEESRSLSMAFEGGVGEEATAYLRYAAGNRVVVQAQAGETVDAQVVVTAVAGAMSAAAIDVVADENSVVNLSIVMSQSGQSTLTHSGITGTTTRVFAGDGARVSVARTQALGEGFADIDDTGVFAGVGARVEVRHTVMGANKTFTGLACDLRGTASRIDIDTHYLGRDDQEHDFNYLVRHHGERTQCDLKANGVLAGKSSKTLRGTIDLIRGAKGAEGSENETVLLVDQGVHNKTVPIILCNEDDVAGNHGATIGHIRDEQMFYLACRGLAQDAAEQMFVSAIMEQAAIDAPDDEAREAVVNLGETMTPGFAGLFE